MRKPERFNWRVTILISLILAGSACSKQELLPLAIKNVTVIDGTGIPPKENMTVLLRGNRIAQIAAAEEVTLPAGTIEVDGVGKYLLPGLWDTLRLWSATGQAKCRFAAPETPGLLRQHS